MRVIRSVAALVAGCVFPLGAQITTTLSRLPDGYDEVRIRNGSSVNVAAFVATVKPARAPFVGNAPFVNYSDPLVDPVAKPLAAGEERVLWRVTSFGMMSPKAALGSKAPPGSNAVLYFEGPVTTAGIFADGTTFGDAGMLTRLMLRRSNMLLAVETTLETLSDAGMHNVPRAQLIDRFRKMVSSMNRWYVLPEQQVGDGLYQSMVGKLMSLPDEPVGAAFPPAAFIAQETGPLRQQRIALLESEPSLSFVDIAGK